jgi:hypothetical protein
MSNDLSPGGASSLNAAQILAKLTGATALAAGAILFGAGSALLTTLPASTNGYFLSLVAGAPAWVPSPSAALPVSYVVGDTLYASSASALSRLAAVAVGQALVSNGVGVAPSWSASPLFTGIVTAKPTTTAGIALDPNAATGNFTLSLSPTNITAARRWSFPDRSDTVAGLGAQTFTGAQTVNGTITGLLGLVILGGTLGGPANLELGNVSGTATTPYIDFNTSATAVDYNVRLIASGAAAGLGAGTLTAFTSALIVNVDPGGSERLRVGGGAMLANGVQGYGQISSVRASSYSIDFSGGQARILGLGPSVGTMGGISLAIASSDASVYTQVIDVHPDAIVRIRLVTVIGTDPGGSALLRVGGSLFNSLGTITTAQQAIDSSVTWNSGVTAFTGWKLNVTDTASAAGSLLLDLQVGGVSKFSVRKDGLGLLTLGGLAYAGANNGELWFDSGPKTLKFFGCGIQQNISSTIHTGLTISGTGPSNTTAATSLIPAGNGTRTIPANFWQGGSTRAIRITLTGILATTGTPTLTLLVKLGSTVIASSGAVTMAANASGNTTVVVTLSQTTTNQVFGTLQCLYSVAGGAVISQAVNNNSGCDLTVAQTIDVTAAFGTASASNAMLIAVSSIELLG